MSDFQTYHFKNCHVRYFPAADYLETVFPDGAKCPAQFTFTREDAEKATELGYSDTIPMRAIRQMNIEHELSHTFIAEALGESYCPVLRSVAVKGPCEGAWEREELVMDWQRFLNGATASSNLLTKLRGSWVAFNERLDFCRRFRK